MEEPDDQSSSVPLNLRVRPATREQIEGIRKATGVSAVQVASRLFDWFCAQPEPVRDAILKRQDPTDAMVRLRTAEMSAAGDGGGDVSGWTAEEALRMIRLMADRLEQITAAYKHHIREQQAGESKKKG